MGKETCDHCDITNVDEHDPNYRISWCAECVKEDYQILNQLQLITSNGVLMFPFTEDEGCLNFADQKNIAKLKQVPKRGQSVPTITGIDMVVQPQPETPEPPFNVPQLDSDWFARYNSLGSLPGRRHYE